VHLGRQASKNEINKSKPWSPILVRLIWAKIEGTTVCVKAALGFYVQVKYAKSQNGKKWQKKFPENSSYPSEGLPKASRRPPA
jgi:hypothetical protein